MQAAADGSCPWGCRTGWECISGRGLRGNLGRWISTWVFWFSLNTLFVRHYQSFFRCNEYLNAILFSYSISIKWIGGDHMFQIPAIWTACFWVWNLATFEGFPCCISNGYQALHQVNVSTRLLHGSRLASEATANVVLAIFVRWHGFGGRRSWYL